MIVSACLAGVKCRYDGCGAFAPDVMAAFENDAPAPLCPEQIGGLPTPRKPAHIEGGTGEDVLEGKARVVAEGGGDVTGQFLRGALGTLDMAKLLGARRAVLKEGSPSCGVRETHGRSGKVAGMGVTAALLWRNGIRVFSEKNFKRR